MFELRSSEFERFSQSSASFLSEAGTVLTFFCFVFLCQDKKMKWALGKAPDLIK